MSVENGKMFNNWMTHSVAVGALCLTPFLGGGRSNHSGAEVSSYAAVSAVTAQKCTHKDSLLGDDYNLEFRANTKGGDQTPETLIGMHGKRKQQAAWRAVRAAVRGVIAEERPPKGTRFGVNDDLNYDHLSREGAIRRADTLQRVASEELGMAEHGHNTVENTDTDSVGILDIGDVVCKF